MNFDHFLGLYRDERIDDVIVCHLEQRIAAAIGCGRGRVWLSLDTVKKQREHHPDLDEVDYRVLPPCLAFGELRQDTDRTIISVYSDTYFRGYNYRACIKGTRDGRIFVTSFNRLRDSHMAKLRRKDQIVIREHQ
ncbi:MULTISPECIES: hypothetical protein [Asticcacaulis]|uniref:hypothetical protein n=1 Tax=Asticcacaulis TaxID=76890 RepID=UPI001AEA3C7C|nr:MULTISPECIES: hypothetical protein [Asticcacaulis]